MAKKKTELPQLTKAEERVMKALWHLDAPALVRDLIDAMPAPKPHANTVNTILKILVEKAFVRQEPLGHANRYHALVTQADYSRRSIGQFVKGYFNGSFADMVSFFVTDKSMDIAELEAVLKALKKKKP